MDRDDVGAGLTEPLHIANRPVDHQMDIQYHVGLLADRLQHRQAKRNIGDKDAVHHVKVEIVGAGLPAAGNVLAQAVEVGRQNGRCDFTLHRWNLQKNIEWCHNGGSSIINLSMRPPWQVGSRLPRRPCRPLQIGAVHRTAPWGCVHYILPIPPCQRQMQLTPGPEMGKMNL